MAKFTFPTIVGSLTFSLILGCGNNVKFQGGKNNDVKAEVQIHLNQIDRASFTDDFSQALVYSDNKDTFTQGISQSPLDLVVIIDNSISMTEEQANLSDKLGPLLTYISDSDWQISISTTDIDDSCQRALIKKDTINKRQLFASAINAGIDGNSTELGLYKAVENLEGGCLTTPWVRPNSTVAVLIVSDEDNCSSSANVNNCLGTGSRDSSFLLNYLESIRTPGMDARVYGIISHPSSPCDTAQSVGEEYAELITATSGTWGDICDADYSNALTTISQDIASILQTRFTLDAPPVDTSVTIKVDGVEIPRSDFIVLNYSIKFLNPPPTGAKIEISYDSTNKVLQKVFPLSNAASADFAKVFVGGGLYPEDKYYIDTISQTLVFTEPPPVDAEFVVEYRENTSLQTEFQIKKGIKTKTMSCAINGEESSEYSYNPSTGLLVFENPPPDAAEIFVTFEK